MHYSGDLVDICMLGNLWSWQFCVVFYARLPAVVCVEEPECSVKCVLCEVAGCQWSWYWTSQCCHCCPYSAYRFDVRHNSNHWYNFYSKFRTVASAHADALHLTRPAVSHDSASALTTVDSDQAHVHDIFTVVKPSCVVDRVFSVNGPRTSNVLPTLTWCFLQEARNIFLKIHLLVQAATCYPCRLYACTHLAWGRAFSHVCLSVCLSVL